MYNVIAEGNLTVYGATLNEQQKMKQDRKFAERWEL